ncbi:TROVE domain-containing protein [Candidatus Entotheonella palauensis]|uniref:TROVE domain-containing protein n=1 Tax=Candidatus Entotheonella palauensis TaxID=93172 RepID=UPI000B7FFA54|nr:TROVE domain-containing protein [Candidatus Entotheonella palauensis]
MEYLRDELKRRRAEVERRRFIRQRETPQHRPIPGSAQVPNSAGGYTWAVDDWTRLHRFLVLGSEGGSYYASEAKLSAENADAVLRCIAADGPRVVDTLVAVSEAGRAPKNDAALFVLALCAARGHDETRRAVIEALPRVARIGTHLFHFVAFVDALRGWGRGLRQAVGNWYNARPARDLAYQALKYQQRDGWSHRDVLRLAHPKAPDEPHQTIYHWIAKGWEWVGEMPHPDVALQQIWAFERAKRAGSAEELTELIRTYRLPREAVPAHWLAKPQIWEALLEEMPMTALLRNLATLTRLGVLTAGGQATRRVTDQLTNREWLQRARVHPIAVLSALKTYARGHGARGRHTWQPIASVIDALDAAFYATFDNVTPTRKRWVLALDVSASMGWGNIAGVPGLSPRVASAAMALIQAATEPENTIVAFSTTMRPLSLSPRQRLDDVVKQVQKIPMGGTDCALPMVWAMDNHVAADVFVIYTDNETWHGNIHPAQALSQYRASMGIDAKLVVVGMVANSFSIADPNDAGMLDCVGFDTATPQLISDFATDQLL